MLRLIILMLVLIISYHLLNNYGYMDTIEVNNVADYLYNDSLKDTSDEEKKTEVTYPIFTNEEINDLSFSVDNSY